MAVDNWQEALWRAAKEVMVKGGEVRFIVLVRENGKRVPMIYKYPECRVVCDEVVLID